MLPSSNSSQIFRGILLLLTLDCYLFKFLPLLGDLLLLLTQLLLEKRDLCVLLLEGLNLLLQLWKI
jgi:hypothetical protein